MIDFGRIEGVHCLSFDPLPWFRLMMSSNNFDIEDVCHELRQWQGRMYSLVSAR